MILVKLGTQHQEFKRLLDYIEKSNINDEIIVQSGYTKYKSKKMKIYEFISYDKMQEYTKKSKFIITHGGTGSIVESLQMGKRVIACARKKKYNEHADDHQEEIVDALAEDGYILKLDEKAKLDNLIKKMESFEPKKFKSNTRRFIKILKENIDKE